MFGDRRAVSIRCTAGSCAAVAALKRKRFIAAEAPRLPLPGCTRPEDCACEYEFVAERRDDFQPANRAPARGLLRFFSGKRSTDVA
jgi:hypothetical protein